jgi:ribosomal subunit interface protein
VTRSHAGEAGDVIDIAVTSRGSVSQEQSRRARERLARLDRFVSDPVLGVRVILRCEPNPRLERPARADAEVDVNGHLVCGRVAAPTMSGAIDELADQLKRQLEDFAERRARLRRRVSQPEPGEWRHGALAAPRPAYFPRPVDERGLMRRKTFARDALDPLQAVSEMLDLDHDFYLFRDAHDGADAVVYCRDDGRIGLIAYADGRGPQAPGEELVHEASRFSEAIRLETAVSEMNALSHRFMFFVNAETSRGNVIYMRYDGHYGLIEPAT